VTRRGPSDRAAEQVGRLLVELVRRSDARTIDPGPLLDQVPAAVLVDRALHHRVPGVVYRSLVALGRDGADFADLRSACQMATLAHGRCLVELASVAEVLRATPWMVVKGPVLAELAYGDPGARLYEDLDLVVPAADLSVVLQALEDAGGEVTDLNWPMMVDLVRAEIPMILSHGMLADLHWHLLVTPRIRSRFSMTMDELFARRRSVPLGGVETPTLDVVDGLLYLCLHGSLSGGDQLVWLKDLDQAIEAEEVDWDELVRRARRYRVALVAAIQLERARVVLGAGVPESVPADLAGGEPWWRWWRMRERRVGLAEWGASHRSDGRMVSATSDGSVASAVELSRVVATDMAEHYLKRPRSHGAEPDDAVPTLYRSEGAQEARAAYLSLVEAGTWE
jgi:hypothetical protein